MTIMETINHLDAVKPNSYSQAEKIRWLSNVEAMIKKEIIDTHEGGENITFNGYDTMSLAKELIAPAPYDSLYIFWLEAQIDYANGEYAKYNNSITQFNTSYSEYARCYHREHMPKTTATVKNW